MLVSLRSAPAPRRSRHLNQEPTASPFASSAMFAHSHSAPVCASHQRGTGGGRRHGTSTERDGLPILR